jgi:DNA-binding IclR family transcriptional regulator
MSTETKDRRPRVEAVERALILLKSFEVPDERLTLATLAHRSGFYKSTILRLTASLEYMGFLRRDSIGYYTLGPELRRLGALTPATTNLETVIRPALKALMVATQETASFYVRDGDRRMCLFRENSPRAMRHHLEEGIMLPLNCGASGRILFAYSDNARNATSAAIRKAGWYASLGERDPEIAAVAVPLHNAGGELLGAMAVSGLISRFTPSVIVRIRGMLRKEAEALSTKLPRRPENAEM